MLNEWLWKYEYVVNLRKMQQNIVSWSVLTTPNPISGCLIYFTPPPPTSPQGAPHYIF